MNHRFVVERLHRGQWLREGSAATLEGARSLPADRHAQFRIVDTERGLARLLDVTPRGCSWAEKRWGPVDA